MSHHGEEGWTTFDRHRVYMPGDLVDWTSYMPGDLVLVRLFSYSIFAHGDWDTQRFIQGVYIGCEVHGQERSMVIMGGDPRDVGALQLSLRRVSIASIQGLRVVSSIADSLEDTEDT